ncbi:MAG: hypothetical protein ACI4PZ_04180 [Akkermansia sp.]
MPHTDTTIPTARDFESLLNEGLEATIIKTCKHHMKKVRDLQRNYMINESDLKQESYKLLQKELQRNEEKRYGREEFIRIFLTALKHAISGILRRRVCTALYVPDNMLKMVSKAKRAHRDSRPDALFTLEELCAANPTSRRNYLSAAYEACQGKRLEPNGQDTDSDNSILDRCSAVDDAYDDRLQVLRRLLAKLNPEQRALADNVMSNAPGKDRDTCTLLGISQPTLRKRREAFLARLRVHPIFAELRAAY